MAKEEKGPDKYEIQNALDTLIRAEEIKKDAKMMAILKPKLLEKSKALEKITSLDELRSVADSKINKREESDEDESDEDEA